MILWIILLDRIDALLFVVNFLFKNLKGFEKSEVFSVFSPVKKVFLFATVSIFQIESKSKFRRNSQRLVLRTMRDPRSSENLGIYISFR